LKIPIALPAIFLAVCNHPSAEAQGLSPQPDDPTTQTLSILSPQSDGPINPLDNPATRPDDPVTHGLKNLSPDLNNPTTQTLKALSPQLDDPITQATPGKILQ
jgi:hypothetical protein